MVDPEETAKTPDTQADVADEHSPDPQMTHEEGNDNAGQDAEGQDAEGQDAEGQDAEGQDAEG